MLTNGGLEAVRALLDRAYLADLVERNLSVDGVHGNRRRGPSRHAAAELAVAPERLALVAAHPWDCAGARAAGLPAAWVNRSRARWPAVFPAPDVSGPDLTAVIDELLASGRSR